jgi:hypothetical protein
MIFPRRRPSIPNPESSASNRPAGILERVLPGFPFNRSEQRQQQKSSAMATYED